MQEKQRGAVVIVEATFVFPIMFIIVFVMLMACEAYYQYSRVEKACIVTSIQGAARCENPMLESVIANSTVPTSPTAVKVRPYRYVLTSEAKNIAEEMADQLEDTVNGYHDIAFSGMAPRNVLVEIKPRMNLLVSSFPVYCSFEVKLPIRMLFSDKDLAFEYEVQVTEPIGDPAEFVRNVSFVQDMLERTGIQGAIDSALAPIIEKIKVFMGYIN